MINKVEDKSLMVKCECGAEALEVQFWPNMTDGFPDEFYFSHWKQEFFRPLPWREKLRWCWNILRTGNPWGDDIITTPQNAKRIADFIIENLQNGKKEDSSK